MRTVCVYHSIDLDGWMSAAIVKHWFFLQNTKGLSNYFCFDLAKENNPYGKNSAITLDFLGWNYGQPVPNLTKYNKVIMCDISFPRIEMHALASNPNIEFIWIDHHISAITENIAFDKLCYEECYKGICDTKFAACELTWQYFFPNEPMPEIVRLLGRYDCFGHKGTDEALKVIEFQYGARSVIIDIDTAYLFLRSAITFGIADIEKIHAVGIAIYDFLCTEAKQSYKNGFEIKLQESIYDTCKIDEYTRKFICINKERFNPINFGIDYHKDGYDGAACFHYTNGKWNFSLYNDNGLVDCSAIVKYFKGGGHKGAAGMILNDVQFLSVIKG